MGLRMVKKAVDVGGIRTERNAKWEGRLYN